MPVIDLKNVNIYFEDGTALTGLINNGAGYAPGATTIVVDTFTSKVPVGARLSIDGDDRYSVVSTTETSSATTTIVFTPSLHAAVLDNAPVLAFGVFLKIKVGDGTCTFSEKKPREYKLDRGLLDSVRNGDQVPMDVSIGLMYIALTASAGDPPTPEDALKQRGAASGWINADVSDPCAPFAINIRLDHQPPGCTAFQVERVILPSFRYEELNHDPKAGTIACTGKCNALEALVSRFTRA